MAGRHSQPATRLLAVYKSIFNESTASPDPLISLGNTIEYALVAFAIALRLFHQSFLLPKFIHLFLNVFITTANFIRHF